MRKIYKARIGSRLSNLDAQVLGERIEYLSKEDLITPEKLVEDAKYESSPIHNYFEWNDQTAAYNYRIDQARLYLRSIVIEIEDLGEVRAFHNVYIEKYDDNQYASLEKVTNTPSLISQVIKSALKEANGWKERYKTYKQLSPIVDAIELLNKGENL